MSTGRIEQNEFVGRMMRLLIDDLVEEQSFLLFTSNELIAVFV